MDPTRHYFMYMEKAMRANWSAPALSDYEGSIEYSCQELAQAMERLKQEFYALGIKPGDKLAIVGRNCSNWAVAYLAIAAFKGVVVTILPDWEAENIEILITHSDARVLFASHAVLNKIALSRMKHIEVAYSLEDLSIVKGKLPQPIPTPVLIAAQWHLPTDNIDDLALIHYADDDIAFPKGIMLTHRNISSNVMFGQDSIATGPNKSVLSLLPLSQMLGLVFDFLYPLAGGAHIYFVTKALSYDQLLIAFQKVQPYMFVTIPHLIEKIAYKLIIPRVKTVLRRILWRVPIVGHHRRKEAYNRLMRALGGKIEILIIGDGILDKRVEACLRQIRFPYTCGYGVAECGPLVGYEFPKQFAFGSVGKVVDRMEVSIDSPHYHRIPGEILVRGENVTLGYYRDMQLTNTIFTDDGWMRTGDTGTIDKEGNIFLKGKHTAPVVSVDEEDYFKPRAAAKVRR